MLRSPPASLSIVVSLVVVALLAGSCKRLDVLASSARRVHRADGPSLYAPACASCHGADLAGTDRGPPFLDPIYRPGHHADSAFLLAVRRGARSHHSNSGNMPPVDRLSDEQVAAIVEFIRAQQVATGIE